MINRLLVSIGLVIITSSVLKAEKRAMIIAIGDYLTSTGWTDISSGNDVIHVQSALHLQGFSAENITILRDKNASYKGIQESIMTFIDQIEPGDIVYLHYSGHGQQVQDDNFDELDGLDEALVPYDSPKHFAAGKYEGESLIRDDLINEWLNQIRKICGTKGQVVFVFDSCHSGTGTRGQGVARGTDEIMAPKNFEPIVSVENKEFLSQTNSDSNLAPWVAFYGSAASELNYETVDNENNAVGSLSFTLSKAIANLHSSYTYRDLFEKVRLQMLVQAPKQNPKFEGTGDAMVFKSSFSEFKRYYSCLRQIDAQTIEVEAGTLTGFFEGSKASLIAVENNSKICSGEIIKSSLASSILKMDCEVDLIEDGALYKVEFIEKASQPILISLYSDVESQSVWNETVSHVLGLNFVNSSTCVSNYWLQENQEKLELKSKEGATLWSSNSKFPQELNREKLIERLKSITQCKFLKTLEESNFSLSMEVQMIDKSTNQQIVSKDIKIGSKILLKVVNNGLKAGYFSIIDIQPDDQVNVLVPHPNGQYTAEDFFLEAGQTMTVPYELQIAPPLGNDVLKLIVTEKALNLNKIIRAQGNTRGLSENPSPFEELLSLSYNNTRGYRNPRLRTGSLSVTGYSFTITK